MPKIIVGNKMMEAPGAVEAREKSSKFFFIKDLSLQSMRSSALLVRARSDSLTKDGAGVARHTG